MMTRIRYEKVRRGLDKRIADIKAPLAGCDLLLGGAA